MENKEIDNLLSKRAILEEQLKETDCKLKQFKAPNERVDKYLSEFLERKNKKVDTNQ
ncbi:MAG: hypothetical protein LBU14_04880 [Candidatus Peribacteria bacterium]|nr:hypothetical protein [Candidatus Peribacteria bacterium]